MAAVDDYLAGIQADPNGPIGPAVPGGIGGLSSEETELMLYLSEHPEIMAQLQEEMGYADALRGTPTPEGRSVNGVYVAANPLEFVGQMYRAKKGGDEAKRITGAREDARGKMVDARRAEASITDRMNAEQQKWFREYLNRGMNQQDAYIAALRGPAAQAPAASPAAQPPMAASQGVPEMLRRNAPPQQSAAPQRPGAGMSQDEMNIIGPNPAGQAYSQLLRTPSPSGRIIPPTNWKGL